MEFHTEPKIDDIYQPLKYIIDELIFYIPEISGWYFWVNANETKHPIYIGKSDANTTWNLKKRIEEGICESLEAFWGTHYNEEEVFQTIYEKYDYKYKNNHLNALKKKNVTHIVWVGTNNKIDSSDIKEIEKYLIFDLQPTANTQHKKKANYIDLDYSKKVKDQYQKTLNTILKNG